MSSRKGDTEKIFSCSLHPEHPLMAFGCETNVVKIYDIHKYSYIRILPMHGLVLAVRFSPCGAFLATASSSLEHDTFRIVVWRLREVPEDDTWKLEKIADDNTTYEILHEDDVKDRASTRIQQFFLHQGRIKTLEFLPRMNEECARLASGSEDQTVRIWTFRGREVAQTTEVWRKHTGTVHCLRASHDGVYLASASSDCTVCIWKLKPGAGGNLVEEVEAANKNKNPIKFLNKGLKNIAAGIDNALGLAAEQGGGISGKLYTHVVEFRARSPVYSLSFFPMVQVFGKTDVRRHIVACGSEKRMFLLKINAATLNKVTAIDFAESFDKTMDGETPEWVLRDKILPPAKKHNALQVELDFCEEIKMELSTTSGSEKFKALGCLATDVHEAYFSWEEKSEKKDKEKKDKEREEEPKGSTLHRTIYTLEKEKERAQGIHFFLIVLGGGSGGKLYAWIFSPTPNRLPESIERKVRDEFVPYPFLKRLMREDEYEKWQEALDEKKKRNSKKSEYYDKKAKEKAEQFKKTMHRLRNGFIPIGEHMEGSNILDVSLPAQYPTLGRPTADMKMALHRSKNRKLLNVLRDEYKMLHDSDYVAVTVSDDETARVFKFSVKDPHQMSFKEDKNEKTEERGILANLGKGIKTGVGGLALNVGGVLGFKRRGKTTDQVPPIFCLASGTKSKATKKMDGTLILQRSLTENQANMLYALNEKARDLRKAKAKKEASAQIQEFKFKLGVDLEKENRAEEFKGSKFMHFQSLAEPAPAPELARKLHKNKAARGQCEGDCQIM